MKFKIHGPRKIRTQPTLRTQKKFWPQRKSPLGPSVFAGLILLLLSTTPTAFSTASAFSAASPLPSTTGERGPTTNPTPPLECSDLFGISPPVTASVSHSASDPDLDALLLSRDLNGAELIDFLSRDPELNTLFLADSGVQEGYSVREHTLRVFDVWKEQCPLHTELSNIATPSDLRIFPLLKFAVALHDIGKSLAVRAGDRSRQHEYTLPILKRQLEAHPFTPSEKNLAVALVSNDVIGLALQEKITLREAIHRLKGLAATTSLSLRDYSLLQILFYTTDAASYPWLRENVFQPDPKGKLVPKSVRFGELIEEINNPITAENRTPGTFSRALPASALRTGIQGAP